MYTTYHLTSAQEINTDILDAIKAIFKSKPITIIVEDSNNDNIELSSDIRTVLDERLKEDEEDYFTGKQSIELLNKKYGI